MLTWNRYKESPNVFFAKAIVSWGLPEKVTIDQSGANTARLIAINSQLSLFTAILLPWFVCNEALKLRMYVRQIKYLNNIVEQDHGCINRITSSMARLKAFYAAEATF